MHCRRNQATLNASEKAKYVVAVLALKASGKYDQYVNTHMGAMAAAHRGPAFLPWHREFLRRFELDLRAIDPSVTLPYWDWSVDNSATSSIWDASFMGGNGRPSDGWVDTGPFANSTGSWTLIYDGPALRRRFGVSASALPTPSDVTNALSITPYDVAPFTMFSASGFRNRLEGWISGPQLHNLVHVWIGGSMGPMSSPNDPVFFLHHCFIDKLWADWQALHPAETYQPISGAAAGHNLNDSMEPWASLGEIITPASVFDHHALDYCYDTEPMCAPTLKFRDDPITLKFRDDPITVKFQDDPITLKFRDDPITLKFRDDPITLKFRDDPITVKFQDDPITLKFRDDPITLKFRDDGGGTSPQIDPIKQPALDKPPLTDVSKIPGTEQTLPGSNPVVNPAPFVLSTPHHSMAWAQSFPEAHQAAIARQEAAVAEAEDTIRQINEAFQRGELNEAQMRAAETTFQQYQELIKDLEGLQGTTPGCC
jgi:tyrosinase